MILSVADPKVPYPIIYTLAIAICTALETTTMPELLPPSRRADSLLSCTVVGGTQSAALSAPCVMILISPWLPPLGNNTGATQCSTELGAMGEGGGRRVMGGGCSKVVF